MATRKASSRNRALLPTAEDLESRKLLSKVVSGTDIDGDTWTLRLIGPGSLNVTKQVDANGNPSPLNSTTQINKITIAGTDPLASRVIGRVHKATHGDGKVFFQTLEAIGTHSLELPSGLGLLSINMPAFWLGKTTPAGTTPTTNVTPSITVHNGVDTLRFGGVDTTVGQPATLPSTPTPTSDMYNVTLGLPAYGGTRVIIDKSISSSQQAPSSTAGGTPTTVQHGVDFAVSGRLSLFQANEIVGDAAHPPGQFTDLVSTATGTGGTIVDSSAAGTAPFLTTDATLSGGATGQIGNLRIGGNATNLTAVVSDAIGNANARITNFSIGGETNNVLVVASNGLKNAAFGRGMDTVEILTHVINTLEANRGALHSNVFVDQTISRVQFGGDVVNTNVLTGVTQNFATIRSNILGTGATGAPTAPPKPTNAKLFGGMTVLVAGNVTDSVFSASVEPFTNPAGNQVFGDPNQVVLPTGHIAAKVEGKIDNAVATPSQPNTAFYANQVHLNHGPVIPPNVPEAPYPRPKRPIHAPGLHNNLHIPQLKGLPTVPTGHKLFSGGVAIPRGPRKHKSQ
jgi:hypothetical protein